MQATGDQHVTMNAQALVTTTPTPVGSRFKMATPAALQAGFVEGPDAWGTFSGGGS